MVLTVAGLPSITRRIGSCAQELTGHETAHGPFPIRTSTKPSTKRSGCRSASGSARRNAR
jgi:hypothetical protein